MSGRAGVAAANDSPRLAPGLWIAAAVEMAVAVAVSAIMLRAGHPSPVADDDGSHMANMTSQHSGETPWHAGILALAAVAVTTLAWWLATRARVPAILAAASLIGLGACAPLRALAARSHLIGMAALEMLLVAVPLLIIAAVPGRATATRARRSATAWVFVAVLGNSAVLIALHLPVVHERGAALDRVPLWLAVLVVAVGTGYWAAILLTAGHVRTGVRRGALIIGQEVGAILGLATLLGPGLHPRHATAFGMSATVDQRLGGVLMLITCAAVTLPLAKRLGQQSFRTEYNVH